MSTAKISPEIKAKLETFGAGAGMTDAQINELINKAVGQGNLTAEQIITLASGITGNDTSIHLQAYLDSRPDVTPDHQPKRIYLSKNDQIPGTLRRS